MKCWTTAQQYTCDVVLDGHGLILRSLFAPADKLIAVGDTRTRVKKKVDGKISVVQQL